MDVLWQDLRHTLRTLRRDSGFTAVIVLTLAVGIGANTAVFSLVHSTLLEPLPYRLPDRLAMIFTDVRARGVHEARSAYANIRDWKTQNRVFEDLATFDPTSLTLTGGEWPEQISAAKVSANLFSVLGIAPAIGRTFSPAEERRRTPVVVLSHDLWRLRFDASPDAVGRTIEIDGRPFQVVGVMPEGFGFPGRDTRFWLPQTLFTDWEATAADRGTGALFVVGRLRPGVSFDRARTEMDAIATRLERMHPGANAGLGINVVPLYEWVTGHSFRLALWTLFGAVGLVLLIACANAAHLILARGTDRGQELALRQALGATTSRLVRHAVTENVVISLAAAVAGLLLAEGGLRLLIALAPGDLPRLHEVGIDGPVLIYATAVSLAAGVLFGIAPALGSSRGALFGALRAGRGPTRTGRQRARGALIVFQFTLAIILVFGANLLIRSLIAARGVDPGFVSENVLMTNLSVASPARRSIFYERVLREVRATPGVRAVGLVEDLFIGGTSNGAIAIEGGAAAEASFAQISGDAIAGDFFEVMGVPFREGRRFSASDRAESAPVAIINETMARRFWPGRSPVGRRFRPGGPDSDAPWIEVVGVVGDMRRQGLEGEPIAQVFRPYAQAPSRNMNLLVRSDAPVADLASTIRARIASIDRMVPLYHVTTVAEELDDRYLLQRRFQTFLLGLFSAIALMLAAGGIYGLLQYSVARRTHEMGVRIALGARSTGLVLMILRQGLSLAVPGLAVGMLVALWLSETVSALLFGVAASDLTNILVTSGILLITALVACYIPARRAASVDPMTALHR